MAQESRLSIVIESRSAEQQAVDLEKALAALDKAGLRVSATAPKVARDLNEAGRAAGRSSEEARRATVSWQGLGTALKGLGLGLSVGGLVSMFKSVATDVEALNKMSEQIGIAIEDLGALRYAAADMAGMAEGRFDMALRRMTRRIGEAADGGGPAADALKRLKLEARELARMDAGTQFRTIAEAIASMPAQADRLRATMALFDTEGMPLVTMLQKGSGAIKEMEAEARRLGVTINKVDAGRIEELNSAFERVRAQIQGVKQEAAIASLPAVELLSSGLEKLAGNFDVIAKVVGGTVAAAFTIYAARASASTVATFANTVATIRSAKAEVQRTAAVLASTRANLGLSASTAQLTAATAAHAAAIQRLAAVQITAARAGSLLLGVFGGPVGLAVTAGIAATALLTFGSNASKAKTLTTDLAQSVDALSKAFVAANEAKRAGMLLDAQEKLGEAAKQAKDATAALRNLIDVNQWLSVQIDLTGQVNRAFEQLRQNIDDISKSSMTAEEKSNALVRAVQDISKVLPKKLADELLRAAIKAGESAAAVQDLTDKVAALRSLMGTPLPTAGIGEGLTSQLSDEFVRLEAQINRQIALMGKSGQAAQLRYDLEHGELAKLVPLEKQRLLAKIDELDASEKAEEARRRAAAAAGNQAKEIDGLLRSLREQASVLGMTEEQAARYRIETAKGTAAQRQEALALFDKVQAFNKAEQAAEQLNAATREQLHLQNEIAIFRAQQDLTVSGLGMGDRRRQELEQEYQIREEFARRRRELDQAQESESTRISDEAHKRRMESLRSAEEQKIAIVRETAARRQIVEQNWVTGASRAWDNYVDRARNVAGQAEAAFTGLYDGLTNEASNWVMGMEANFKDVLRSFLSMLIQMEIRAAASTLFSSIGGGAGGFIAAAASSLFGGGRAKGGPVSAGRMYEVNEEGIPELLKIGKRQFLMMGSQGGHVTPLAGSASAGSATQQASSAPIVNIYFSESGIKSEAPTGLEHFGAEIARFVDARFKELEIHSYRQGGTAWARGR